MQSHMKKREKSNVKFLKNFMKYMNLAYAEFNFKI